MSSEVSESLIMSGIVRKKNPAQAGLQSSGGVLLTCRSRCTADDLVDPRYKPLWRMIVSACPPSILAFRLAYGRIAYRWDFVTAGMKVDIGRRKSCGQTLGDKLERKSRMMPSVSLLSASNPLTVGIGGRSGALIGQRGAGPRVFPLTATSQLVSINHLKAIMMPIVK